MIERATAPKITIKSILLTNGNWERFKAQNSNLPLYVVEEVEMLHCRDLENGFLWVPITFFEYGSLRRIWQYHLLKAVKRCLPNSPENCVLIDRLLGIIRVFTCLLSVG